METVGSALRYVDWKVPRRPQNLLFWHTVSDHHLRNTGQCAQLKLQYSGHLMWSTEPLEKTLMVGKIEGRAEVGSRGWDVWMASPIQWTWVWASSERWWRTGRPGVLQSMGSQSWTLLSDWTKTVSPTMRCPQLSHRADHKAENYHEHVTSL